MQISKTVTQNFGMALFIDNADRELLLKNSKKSSIKDYQDFSNALIKAQFCKNNVHCYNRNGKLYAKSHQSNHHIRDIVDLTKELNLSMERESDFLDEWKDLYPKNVTFNKK